MGESKNTWLFLAALAVIALLVVTTPGWQEVLGLNIHIDLGKYASAIVLIALMLGILAVVLMTKGEGGSSE